MEDLYELYKSFWNTYIEFLEYLHWKMSDYVDRRYNFYKKKNAIYLQK